MAESIQAGLEVGHWPGFTDDAADEGVTVINTKPRTAVFCGNGMWDSPWTRPSLDYAPFSHLISTFIDDGRRMGVRAVHCPNSDMDNKKRDDILHTRTAVCCSDVSAVLVNSFDKGSWSSDLVWRTSSSATRVFATALTRNLSRDTTDTVDK